MRAKRELLHSFSWHDLPIEEITFAGDGISLVVAPFSQRDHQHRRLRLSLRNAKAWRVALTGDVATRDLSNLEVSSFDIVTETDHVLSGRVRLLPGDAGLWELEFSEATWEFVDLDAIATPAQQRLINYLIDKIATNEEEAERRWGRAATTAQQYARSQQQLLLTRDWTADFVLDESGEVWIINTETAQPPQLASLPQRRAALFRALQPLLCACAGSGWSETPSS